LRSGERSAGHQFDDDGSSHFSTIVAGPAQFHFSGNGCVYQELGRRPAESLFS